MADIVSPETRSRMMSCIKGKNTKPEMQIRKLLYAAGYRYRLANRTLPGNPDLTLGQRKVAIQVNGCFWHGHENCALFRIPFSRAEFWNEKISGNIKRDRKNLDALNALGWRVCTIWECALKGKQKIDSPKLVSQLTKWIETGKGNKDIRG